MPKNLPLPHVPYLGAAHGHCLPGKTTTTCFRLTLPLLALYLLVSPAQAADIEVYALPDYMTTSPSDPAQAALDELPPPVYATEKQVLDVWKANVPRRFAFAYAGTMPPDPANRPLVLSAPKPAPRKAPATKPQSSAVTAGPVQTNSASSDSPAASQSPSNANGAGTNETASPTSPKAPATNGTSTANQGKNNPLAPSSFTPVQLPLPGVPAQPQNTARPTSLLDSAPHPPKAVPTPGGPYSGPAPAVPADTPA